MIMMLAPSASLVRRRVATRIRQLCEVPTNATTTEFAEQYIPVVDGGAVKGPYRVSVAPYQRRWQDLFGNPAVSIMVLCWGSQLGKTTVLRHGISYRIKRLPSGMLMVQPKIDRAEFWVKQELDPLISATKVLRDLMTKKGKTLRFHPFPGGYLFVASAQSASELASLSAAFVACDEVDRFEILPTEGNPLEIVRKRQAAQDIGFFAATSTPRDHDTSLIWPLLELGSNERYLLPCPRCGEAQELVWGTQQQPFGMKWPSGRPDLAEYMCRFCQGMIQHREKRAMLQDGQWAATNPDGQYPSSHLSSLYSPFAQSRWGILAQEFVNAFGKPADLQVFMNTRLGLTWKEATHEVKTDDLAARATEPYEEFCIPDGVGVLTMGVDVQDNRIECWIWGWGAGLESWPIAHVIITGDPAIQIGQAGSPWNELEDLRLRPIRHVSGQSFRIAMTFVDSGYLATTVYKYTDRRKGRGVYACKGVGEPGQPLLGKPSLETIGRVVVFPIGDHNSKNEFLRSQILTKEPGPGFVHLPKWLTMEQLDQLVAEKRVKKTEGGQVVFKWVKKRDDMPNEACDCRRYARGALERLGSAIIQNLAKRAAKWSERVDGGDGGPNPTPLPPVEPEPPEPTTAAATMAARLTTLTKRAKKARGFVTGWKR